MDLDAFTRDGRAGLGGVGLGGRDMDRREDEHDGRFGRRWQRREAVPPPRTQRARGPAEKERHVGAEFRAERREPSARPGRATAEAGSGRDALRERHVQAAAGARLAQEGLGRAVRQVLLDRAHVGPVAGEADAVLDPPHHDEITHVDGLHHRLDTVVPRGGVTLPDLQEEIDLGRRLEAKRTLRTLPAHGGESRIVPVPGCSASIPASTRSSEALTSPSDRPSRHAYARPMRVIGTQPPK